jgi:predicted alpha/beta-hydrolase family hydrolase
VPADPYESQLGTGRGPARAVIHPADRPVGTALLLHGAGTGTDAAPYPALAAALSAGGITAIRFDQPYRVAGRRAPDAARLLDAVVLEVLPALPVTRPLVVVGRSSGARVACRTAAATGAVAIAALGFPWRPPGLTRDGATKPDRGDELRLAARSCPVLVVQGDRDPFGRPARIRGVRTQLVAGLAHTPTKAAALRVVGWLLTVIQGTAPDG